ncbi:MAG: hypothetical protein JSV16_09380, partial [Candidatus Hydrogenedentota bacterium]
IVELIRRLEARRFSIFRQEIHEVETEVLINGDSQSWWRRRIQVMDESLSALTLRYIRQYGLEKPFCKDFHVRLLKERCSLGKGQMEIRNVHVMENIAFFSISFCPYLKRGDIADICCEENYGSAFLMTREKIGRNRIMKSIFKWPEVGLGIDIFAPTGFLRSRVSFPKDYHIDNIQCKALMSRMYLQDECDRLDREQCLSMMRVGSRLVLELSIKQPIMGAQYFIMWRPPTERDYKRLLSKSLNEGRKNQV